MLTAYRAFDQPGLDAGYVQAAARHWSRHIGFGEAEAFEVLRDEGKDTP